MFGHSCRFVRFPKQSSIKFMAGGEPSRKNLDLAAGRVEWSNPFIGNEDEDCHPMSKPFQML